MDRFSCFSEASSSSQCFACQILSLLPTKFDATCTKRWESRRLWVLKDGTPNFPYLRSKFGDEICPIASDDATNEMIFGKYVDYCLSDSLKEIYLKDWHFQARFGASMYTPPLPIQSDWVNREKWTDSVNPFNGDYRFVYIGKKNTWTRFHSDVLSTHSWSANICGRKLWYFVPPGNERFFMKNGQLVEDIRDHQDRWIDAGVIEVIQEEGELFFVPSNWHHQVHNLETTISINHNFINSSNAYLVWEFLKRRMGEIERSLEGVIGFNEEELRQQYQVILLADTRLDLSRFRRFLQLVQEDRACDENATCYVCSQHLFDFKSCFFNSQCLNRLSAICECKMIDSGCTKCKNYIRSLDLTVSSLLLNEMHEFAGNL